MPEDGTEIERRRWIYRHPLLIRVTHWINALCLAILLLSGLQIFNAHPALYFGTKSHFETPSLEVKAVSASDIANGNARQSSESLVEKTPDSASQQTESGDEEESDEKSAPQPERGAVTIFGRVFDTTGWLGYAYGPDGQLASRGFPSALTLPGDQDLATARRWHFTFAWLLVLNGLIYLSFSFASGHVRRDLWAHAREWRDIPRSIWDHIRLRFPRGDEARHYNVLQKVSYLVVIFIMLPVMVLAGMTMSPGLNARFPVLLTVFGGRQTARTVHFILASGLVGFAFVHVAMVIVSGFGNNIRSMITGRYVISSRKRDVHEKTHAA